MLIDEVFPYFAKAHRYERGMHYIYHGPNSTSMGGLLRNTYILRSWVLPGHSLALDVKMDDGDARAGRFLSNENDLSMGRCDSEAVLNHGGVVCYINYIID